MKVERLVLISVSSGRGEDGVGGEKKPSRRNMRPAASERQQENPKCTFLIRVHTGFD